jgi:hypothetical protein
MPDSGVELGADLYALLKAGKSNLPAVGAEFAAAHVQLESAASAAAGVTKRPGYFGGDAVCAEWTEMCRTLDKYVHQTSENLIDSGKALVMAAEILGGADAAARDELKRLRAQNGEPSPQDGS